MIFQPSIWILLFAVNTVVATSDTEDRTDLSRRGSIRSAAAANRALMTCGNGSPGDGVCADGTCCSQFGWCGTSAEHCGGGGGGGSSGGGSGGVPAPGPGPSPGGGTCGNGSPGDGVCADGTCCSQFGWCGTSAEHCGGG